MEKPSDSKETAKWEEVSGDERIMELPKTNTVYFGHSSSTVNWLKEGKDLRVGGSGGGSLEITAIPMPNLPKEFLEHLKKRVDPQIDYYHRGPYVVVLALPPNLYRSYGHDPDVEIVDSLGAMAMKNVKVIERHETQKSAFSVPQRFILGYYDGDNNTFYRNPTWEESPAPTEFGIKAEEKLRNMPESQIPDNKTDELISISRVEIDEALDNEWF